jgi:chloramphenicol 3-O phosphotransferase
MPNECPSQVILLNGVGSVGKSTIAKAFQDIAEAPFLHVRMDGFLDMMPPALANHRDGFLYEAVPNAEKPEIAIHEGPIGNRVLSGMRHAVAAMAGQDNNLIVDDVMLDGTLAEYLRLLAPFQVACVGLFAPLEILEDRERQRGDRQIGLARWQFNRVHKGVAYDLKIDTSCQTPAECARRIKERFSY